MTKRKKAAPKVDSERANGDSTVTQPSSPSPTLTPTPTIPATPSSTPKKTPKPKASAQPPSSPAPLIICRNKHWRYISSFHGPWLQLPPEILETLAHANYNTPRPHPIDPAVFFDLVKIRHLVDEATDLAVRAASGVASAHMSNAPHHAAALGLAFGYGPSGQTKLSRERKHRMREQAAQKLSKAYHLDEIACSVATMQSASSLEEVAALVLQRNANDSDAKYVHFFHEKIPSRQLAECTNLDVLTEIISVMPTEGEPLRTRATVRVFKGDLEGAVSDLTEALRVHRLYRMQHTAPKPQPQSQELQMSEKMPQRNGRWQEDIILKEDDQPSSLELQLLFQRAGVYLTIASQYVTAACPDVPPTSSNTRGTKTDGGSEPQSDPELIPAEKEAQRKVAEARKLVRLNAKRALRDYTAYMAHFEYSPDLPIETAEEFARKVNYTANGIRAPRSNLHPPKDGSPVDGVCSRPNRVYALSELFAATPPSDLPPYPAMELAPVRQQQPYSRAPISTTTETLTYHPLLPDALHSLLLCHCLIQTSAKELLRHAYMVARLARLADGYPVFQASRSPARADWTEILRAGSNWIQLVGVWDDLCAPAPLSIFQSPANGSAERQRKERIHQRAVLEAFSDDRVNDESSFQLAIRARKLRAERDYPTNPSSPALRRWAVDEAKNYSISTDRAIAVARWVLEAPPNAGSSGTSGAGGGADGGAARKRKKKPVKRGAASGLAGGDAPAANSLSGSKTDLDDVRGSPADTEGEVVG
ncbi:hypothetical protein B0H63DRAFT_389491 [Podospora didyma]|uniref:Histidine kinase group protein n=1 Tax=Podospora didyma TaxID=330526 RepID=A0AAE0U3K6_9PEZI|nr:hypothetical protein B0H63DRAFT_389491 [Podospora didyma]